MERSNKHYQEAIEIMNKALTLAKQQQYSTAKIMFLIAAEQMMKLLKQKQLSQQESTLAQEQLTRIVGYAEECKKQIELSQRQLAQTSPHIKTIFENLLIKKTGVCFDDIAGLKAVKQTLHEAIVFPNLRPDIFSGIRAPHKGILFYGPPGNGKTLIAKAVATEAKCCFYNLSAATLVQKLMGEGEKMMQALFKAASATQPSIIFIDEIDSILTARSENEHEASRRLKTEFLVQFDGLQSNDQERIILMGATNRPQEIDHAALRRFTLKIHIDQPDEEARTQLVNQILSTIKHNLSAKDIQSIIKRLDGYSASDIKVVAKEACMEPVRSEIQQNMILTIQAEKLRDVSLADFQSALQKIKPTLTASEIKLYNKFKTDK